MKKIFTFLVMSIFAVCNMSATEEVLWEGNVSISWEDPGPSGAVKE